MATTIVTKNSSTASAVPTTGQLVQGELAVNVADKKLFTEDNAGSIIVLADGVKLAGIEALADVTDTANVTAAGALMDSEVTNLAQVKAFDSADYATAAQGTTADAALPTTGGAMTGAITTNSTFDGRDVATDGTKLDGIEAGATADQTDAEIRAAVEAATDSNVFTDADHSKLNAIEASADVTDTANVTAAGALMDSELTSIASVKALDQGVATTDSPSFVGLTASGEITANGGIALGDSDVATFGNSDDLEIYHDGNNSYIKESGTGQLNISGGNAINFLTGNNADETGLTISTNGAVTAYYDNAAKLATTATGIDVTGTATMDGLTVDSSGTAALFTNGDGLTQLGKIVSDATYGLVLEGKSNSNLALKTKANGAGEGIYFLDTSDKKRMFIEGTTGDISFYEDTGTTAKLTWSASNEDLNFADNVKATFGASDDLQIYHNGSGSYIDDAGTGNLFVRADNLQLRRADGSHLYLAANAGAEVALYHAGNSKLSTTTTGIDVTGTVTADKVGITEGELEGNSGNLQLQSLSTGIIYDAANGFHTFRRNGTNALQINGSTGDISFYEDTGTTPKLFWDASAESLGIGTSSPASGLHVLKGTADVFRLERDATNDWRFQLTTGALAFRDATNDVERLRIDSSGNVGIGETSPLGKTHIKGADTGASVSAQGNLLVLEDAENGLSILSSTAGAGYINFGDSGDNNIGMIVYDHSSNTMKTWVNAAERMRIDASGNVLVGKTANDVTTAGVNLNSNGYVSSSVPDAPAAYFNRISSDGAIANFSKNGTTVGSIGVIHGNNLFIGAPSHSGLQFGSSIVYPTGGSTGDANDATVDIGASGQRFKDLYLSGGVYLGGTGAANKLDDYEEGTFTPTLSATSSGTITEATQVGTYTKIGRVVTCNIDITVASVSSPLGYLSIGALPFASTVKAPASLYGHLFTGNNGFIEGSLGISGTSISISEFVSGDRTTDFAANVQAGTVIQATVVYQAT
jgi:hypothetical protein